MYRKIIATFVLLLLAPAPSFSAPSTDTFQLRNAQDLADLCAVPDGDPMVEAARGFCYGFLSGAGEYHRATRQGKGGKPLVCVPEPPPTRAEAAQGFVDWAKANPQYMQESAIDALFRFAMAKYPCPQQSKSTPQHRASQ